MKNPTENQNQNQNPDAGTDKPYSELVSEMIEEILEKAPEMLKEIRSKSASYASSFWSQFRANPIMAVPIGGAASLGAALGLTLVGPITAAITACLAFSATAGQFLFDPLSESKEKMGSAGGILAIFSTLYFVLALAAYDAYYATEKFAASLSPNKQSAFWFSMNMAVSGALWAIGCGPIAVLYANGVLNQFIATHIHSLVADSVSIVGLWAINFKMSALSWLSSSITSRLAKCFPKEQQPQAQFVMGLASDTLFFAGVWHQFSRQQAMWYGFNTVANRVISRGLSEAHNYVSPLIFSQPNQSEHQSENACSSNPSGEAISTLPNSSSQSPNTNRVKASGPSV